MDTVDRIANGIPEVRRWCLRPAAETRLAPRFIETAFLPYVGDLTANLLRTAVRHGRMAVLPFLPAAFRDIRTQESDRVTVLMELVHEPDAETFRIISDRMKARIGRPVSLESRVVPELVGGLRFSWENRVIDLSVAGRMQALRALLAPAGAGRIRI
jgi:F-type H+-transporting ATPase subunit delta